MSVMCDRRCNIQEREKGKGREERKNVTKMVACRN